ncbi:MAG: hypothetical protein P8166_11670 [Candidatus Thiodiazotropha sp.]
MDEEIIEWIFGCYAWALEQFDRNVLLNETILVIPDNAHFPGREESIEGIANLIFDQVKKYAGVSHWPTRLINRNDANPQVSIDLSVEMSDALRGSGNAVERAHTEATANQLQFFYDPGQINDPEGLIAHFAHGLSYQLAASAKIPPPGGVDYMPVAGELTGVFLGFGLMFANTATVVQGGCGGCSGKGPSRQAFLSQEEATYALALFCVVKGIEIKKATRHLKKHLRRFFSLAVKDCERRKEKLQLQ